MQSHGAMRTLNEGKEKVHSMKVTIIGGGGLVGSSTAFALQCGGVVSSICLIDANKELAQGQALDLLHGASLAADQRISAGDLSEVASSQVVIVTAGLRRKRRHRQGIEYYSRTPDGASTSAVSPACLPMRARAIGELTETLPALMSASSSPTI